MDRTELQKMGFATQSIHGGSSEKYVWSIDSSRFIKHQRLFFDSGRNMAGKSLHLEKEGYIYMIVSGNPD